LGKLIHDFYCKNANDIYNKKLAEKVGFLKTKRKEHLKCVTLWKDLLKKNLKKRN